MAVRWRYLQDLAIGESAESKPRSVVLEDMLAFAQRYDPQYFHTDVLEAKNSVFGGIVASGLYAAALWRQLDHEISGDIRWICGVAWKEVVWPTALRPGDSVRARSEVLSKRRSQSDATRGVVEVRYSLLNSTNATVFNCQSVNLIEVDVSRA